MVRQFLLFLIGIYQKAISPAIPARCRYYPTCSAYARTALNAHTLPKALILIIKRLASCQPFGGSGVDFVPVPMYRYYYTPASVAYSYVLLSNHTYQHRLNRLVRL